MMACEIGGCGALRPDTLAEAYNGIRGVMASLGMIVQEGTRAAVAYREIEARDRGCQLLAPLDGLFEPARSAGEDVEAGEAAGAIHHPFEPERPPTPLHFARAGVITAQLNRGLVQRGEQLYWIGQLVN